MRMTMNDKVKVHIGGQMAIKYDGTVEMKRSLYEQLSKAWENRENGIDEDILDVADAIRNGYVDDPEVDEFELVE
jgi:enamine deaminase RidA (YjgF/YER057c/UK114 family)